MKSLGARTGVCERRESCVSRSQRRSCAHSSHWATWRSTRRAFAEGSDSVSRAARERRVSQQAYGGTNPNVGYGGHDEDQGQMGGISALMKLGLFSLRGTCSKDPIYEITAPEFDEVTIKLDGRYYSGAEFKIKTNHNAPENVYIQKAELNGEPLSTCWFYHRDFAKGGVLELWLGSRPNETWGKSPVGQAE